MCDLLTDRRQNLKTQVRIIAEKRTDSKKCPIPATGFHRSHLFYAVTLLVHLSLLERTRIHLIFFLGVLFFLDSLSLLSVLGSALTVVNCSYYLLAPPALEQTARPVEKRLSIILQEI